MGTERQRIDSIQAMRALAAMMVVAFHSGREVAEKTGIVTPTLRFMDICDFGVDIFFVISGFIMYYVTFNRPTGVDAAKSFLLKRLIRVGPMYWLFTTLFLLPVLFAPALLNRSGVTTPFVISSYIFIPWQRPGADIPSISPVYGLGWTLNYEVFFYIMFAALLALKVKNKLPVIAGLFTILAAIGFCVPGDQSQLFFWTRSLLLEFIAGIAIAALFCRGVRLSTLTGGLMILAGALIWIIGGYSVDIHDIVLNLRGIIWGAAAGLILMGVALSPAIGRVISGRDKGLIQLLGEASFSLYLSHLFVVRIISIIMAKLGAPADPLLLLTVNVVASTVAAIIVYKFMEQPITRAISRRLQGTKPHQA